MLGITIRKASRTPPSINDCHKGGEQARPLWGRRPKGASFTEAGFRPLFRVLLASIKFMCMYLVGANPKKSDAWVWMLAMNSDVGCPSSAPEVLVSPYIRPVRPSARPSVHPPARPSIRQSVRRPIRTIRPSDPGPGSWAQGAHRIRKDKQNNTRL
jgi:hypothetical protein